jgi:hypothetical protein
LENAFAKGIFSNAIDNSIISLYQKSFPNKRDFQRSEITYGI